MTKNNLFSDFAPVSTKEWKQKIQADLKGADYNDTLVWNTNESIDVKPFYNLEDIKNLDLQTSNDAIFKIGQVIYVKDIAKSNAKAKYFLEKGTETIKFIIPDDTVNITELTTGLDLAEIQLQLLFLSSNFFNANSKILKEQHITVISDPINNLVVDGNWFHNLKDDLNLITHQIKETGVISVDANMYQNAGALIHQELAYTLSHLNEYFNLIQGELSEVTVLINCAVGTNYFFEISKIRALKLLVASISEPYNLKVTVKINSTPTKRNKTLYDYNTNMLRTTTECMSAILGGSQVVFNTAYDAIYHKDNEFGERISRNQLLILKGESYFDTVLNASDGSYYIETLTHQLAEKALVLFKEIEANNGFLSQLKAGTIQKKIKESATKEQEQFDAKEITLLGSNKFENPEDKMKDNLELYPFLKQNPRKTLIEPIIAKRLAETYEQERLKQEA